MKVTEKWGDSVDAAVKLACEELDATPDEVEIEVLEEPSRGFFGIGSKLALVRVSVKEPEQEEKAQEGFEDIEGAEYKNGSPNKKEYVTDECPKEDASRETNLADKEESKDKGRDSNTLPLKKKAKKSHKRQKKRENRSKKSKKNTWRDYDKLVRESPPIMPVADPDDLEPLEDSEAKDFLQGIVDRMDVDMTVEARSDGKATYLYMEGKNAGTVIGRRGVTLDALQYLTGLAVNKGEESYKRIILDTENYRAKRERSLEKLALRLADKVVRNGRSFRLEPMNPYERKVIHTMLQKDNRVITRSEGKDPYRRVVIDLK